jgi:hypothetical protein
LVRPQPQTGDAETDLSNATAVGLLENLPVDQQVFDDLHRWLSVETFEGCKALFLYHLSEKEYNKLHSDFIRKKKGVTQSSVSERYHRGGPWAPAFSLQDA